MGKFFSWTEHFPHTKQDHWWHYTIKLRKLILDHARFVTVIVLTMKSAVFQVLTPYKLVYEQVQLFRNEDGLWRFLQYVCTHLRHCNPQTGFLLLHLYNSLWVLACSIISFHCFLSCTFCFQFFTPILARSFLTSSSHLNLGLPFGLVAYSFHLYMILGTLSFVILSTCPNQLNLLLLMCLTIFSYLIAFSSSSFVLSLQHM